MNKLLIRIVLVGLISILSFAVVSGLIIRIGYGTIVSRAEEKNNILLAEYIGRKIQSLSFPDDIDPSDPDRFSSLLGELFQDLPVNTEYIAVQTPGCEMAVTGRRGMTKALNGEHRGRHRFSQTDWYTVSSADGTPCRYSFEAVKINSEASSRIVLSAIKQTALWGGLAACFISVIVAYLISFPLSSHAGKLAAALSEMKNGRRDVALPRGGVQEFRNIADCAADLQDSLLKEESVRRQWSSDIAHDLRTPLSVLKGQFEGMIDGVLRTDGDRLERNYQEILKLEHLINQLADLSRMESPGYKPNLSTVDARSLLMVQKQRFRDSALERNIRFSTDTREAQPVPIQADAELLERALGNLISNAILYGEEDSDIRLSLDMSEEGFIGFDVDNAGLIELNSRSKIFNRLYRGDQSRSTRGEGLGLAIVQAVAQAHNGTVSFSCDESVCRTRFRLTIPVS